MKIIPVIIENGVLKIPDDMIIPNDTQISVLLTKTGEDIIEFTQGNKSFSFLEDEPDLYSDADLLKDKKNEKFQG